MIAGSGLGREWSVGSLGQSDRAGPTAASSARFEPIDSAGRRLHVRYELPDKLRKSDLPWHDEAVEYKLFAAAEECGCSVEELPPVVTAAVSRELRGLASSTEASYGKHWARWVRFCGAQRLCPLPASTTAVLAWMVLDLCQTVVAQNFQPYLSAVNKAHEHLELQKPAVGERVSATRRSIAADAVKLVVEPQRIRVSADVIADALDEAVNDPDAPDELVRATVAVVIDSVCCSRGDTGVGIKVGDVKTTAQRQVVVRLRRHKGEVRREELTGQERVLVFESDAVVGLYELVKRWEFIRSSTGVASEVARSDSYYALRGERSDRWTQSKMDSFLQVVLQQQGVEAPAGFSYSYHSLRKMAASSIKCIGVSDQRLQFFGRWKDIATANDRYVDAACRDTYGCYRLFGHLLPAADRLCGVAKRRDDMCQW